MVTKTLVKLKDGGARRFLDFKEGFFAPFRAIKYIFGNPGTLKFALPPVPIVAVLLFFGIYYGVGATDDILEFVWSEPGGDAWYVTWLLNPVWHLLLFVLGMVMLTLSVIAVAITSLPIAGPFMEMLAEKVEKIETGFEAPFNWGVFFRNVVVSIFHVLIFTSMGLFITAGAFALSFIPIVGQVIALVVSFTVVPMMLAFTPLDYPMTVRLWTFADKLRFVWRNLSFFYGFALATYLFLYVPFMNLLLLPACVVAATLTLIRLEEEGRLDFRDRRKEVLVARGAIGVSATPDGGVVAMAPVEDAEEAGAETAREVEVERGVDEALAEVDSESAEAIEETVEEGA